MVIRKRILIYRLFLIFLMFSAGIVGLEVYLRHSLQGLHTQSLPRTMIEQHASSGEGFVYDRDLMWYWKLPNKGAGINPFGFRRSEAMTEKKPKDTIRVIALGDSQTYGGGVGIQESFSFYAEESLGENWEVLNAGISGYRSLNIFRLLRKKMLRFDPDIIVLDTMLFDSPAETGALHETSEISGFLWLREMLWNSRINYVVQLSLRRAGFGVWEDLPWPIQLHQVRENKNKTGEGHGNHVQIARWAKERGILAVFMEYPTQKRNGELECLSSVQDLPNPGFRTCTIIDEIGIVPRELFIDTNHFTPLGARVVGEALAEELPILWKQYQNQ